MIRYNWTLKELQELQNLPLLELITKASRIHQKFHDINEVQTCQLISIRTGGCVEDCKYCAQSSRYHTGIKATPLMSLEEVIKRAKQAKQEGCSRVCLGAAWRDVKDNRQFDQVLEMVKALCAEGVEVCCTLGMLSDEQAKRLKEAGLYAYNHNLDSSEEFYKTIITTRKYHDRLRTLGAVRRAGVTVCSGGILGLGETKEDRLLLLLKLSSFDPHPESVPINRLVPMPGTPLEGQKMVEVWDWIRTLAIARIVMPRCMLRLSAGREEMTIEQQALCFLAGANSIFWGDQLLTAKNAGQLKDEKLFEVLNLKKKKAFEQMEI